MCEAIVVGLVVGAISSSLGVAAAHEQAQAQADANARAAKEAMKKRQLELVQINREKTQKIAKAQQVDTQVEIAQIEAMGRVAVEGAETGLGGRYLKTIGRNVQMQTNRERGANDASFKWGMAASDGKVATSAFNYNNTINTLPEVQSPGLQMASGVIGGISTGVSVGGAFKDDGATLGGWGWDS